MSQILNDIDMLATGEKKERLDFYWVILAKYSIPEELQFTILDLLKNKFSHKEGSSFHVWNTSVGG